MALQVPRVTCLDIGSRNLSPNESKLESFLHILKYNIKGLHVYKICVHILKEMLKEVG